MQNDLIPTAALLFTLYSIGFPAFVAYILLTNKRACQEDQILRAQKIGNTRASNPYHYEFRKRYARLYYHFKPNVWYWILCILGRKFCLVSVALLFRENPTFQLCMMLLVLFISYALHVRNLPYMSMSEVDEVLETHKDIIQDHKLTMQLERRVSLRNARAKLTG